MVTLCLHYRFDHVTSIYSFLLFFLLQKSLSENEPQKLKNLKKILRKSPVSDAWAAIFKNADFPWNSLKVTKLGKF